MAVNVLCIEDEHFISELYVRALTKAGYETKVMFDGQEGLKEALTDTYDVILLDIMLPGMNGMDILANLTNAENKHLKAKVIITTNLQQDDETRQRIEQQADGYLIKAEITPRDLVHFLHSLEQTAPPASAD